MSQHAWIAAPAALVVALTTVLVVPTASSATVTQSASCVDGGGAVWDVRSVWGAIYTGSDGKRHVGNDATGFSTTANAATTVDYSIRSFNADGSQASVQGAQDKAFDFDDGAEYLTRNPVNPIVGDKPARITVSVGDGNDGEANCSVIFTQPGVPTSSVPSVTGAEQPGNSTSTEAAVTQKWGAPLDGDEFNYSGPPNPEKWSVYNGDGHAGQGLRRPAAFSVSGSYVRITGDSHGTTGGMSARFDKGVVYGRWETRMRVPKRDPEYHPVLIVYPLGKRDATVNYQEIDYAESTKDPKVVKFFLHYKDKSTTSSAQKTLDMTQWHNYAVDWAPGRITGYVDGVKWFEDTTASHQPTAPSKSTIQLDWFPDGSSTSTSVMDVDWARYYRAAS